MLNPRVGIPILILSAAIMALPTSVSAQGVNFQVYSNPRQVRDAGLTETLGSIVLMATGTGTIPVTSAITIVYDAGARPAVIANTVDSHVVSGSFRGVPCGSGVCTSDNNMGSMSATATANSLTLTFNTTSWTFIAGDYLEISQIRANVSSLTGTVTAALSASSTAPITNGINFLPDSMPVASIAHPALKVTFPSAPAALTCTVPPHTSFSVTATEVYAAAFTSLADETGFTPNYPPAHGTQVIVTISNFPTQLTLTSPAPITTAPLSVSAPTVSHSGTTVTFTYTINSDSPAAFESIPFIFNIGGGPITGPLTTTVTASVRYGPSSGVVSFSSAIEASGTVVKVNCP